MVNVESNVKLASSGDVPTTGTLPKGYMAFGNFGGKNKLYGNVGSEVADLIGDAKTVLYFASQSELNEFLQGSDVPVGEWYASIAEKTYEQYREWAAFKLGLTNLVGASAGSQAYPPMTLLGGSDNASNFYQIGQPTSFDEVNAVEFGNYAHTRYYLYLDFDQTPSGNLPWDVIWLFKQANGNSYSLNVMGVSGNDIENPTVFTAGHFEGNMQNYTSSTVVGGEENIYVVNTYQALSSLVDVNISGYLVVKEIIADGEPWINWEEIKAMEANNG